MKPRLEHQALKVRTLVEEYRAGRIVIPEFQRDYVWRKNKAPKLVDSLYRGFPISSLLLWQSMQETRSRRRDPRPSRAGAVNWLIDGQQRVITLARTLAGDEGIDVVFNPTEQAFSLSNAATKRDRNWYHVADLLDDDQYRRLRRNLDGGATADEREERFDRLRSILDYEVPVVRMVDHDFGAAVTAFTRINTLGVRLKAKDIESAQVAARHSGFIADEVVPFLDKLRREGFTRMTVMHLFRSCAFIARPDGRNKTPLHELDRREVLAAWRKTERATNDAISLVRSELGLVNMNVLWSGSLLVPVIALCAKQAPRERQHREIAGWLALATLLHRYSGASGSALDQDLRACRSSDPIRALLGNLRQVRDDLSAIPSDFGGSLADRSGFLALYIGCFHRGVRDFYSGGKVLLQPSVDKHHILPRGQFPERRRASADCIANMAVISGAVNKSIGLTGPEVYLRQLPKAVRDSQCIPDEPELWSVERADEFWAARRELLAQAFNDYVQEVLPNRRL